MSSKEHELGRQVETRGNDLGSFGHASRPGALAGQQAPRGVPIGHETSPGALDPPSSGLHLSLLCPQTPQKVPLDRMLSIALSRQEASPSA